MADSALETGNAGCGAFPVVVIVATLFLSIIALLVVLKRCLKFAPQGFAIIRSGMGGTRVSFRTMMVFPVIHYMERIDISLKKIPIVRTMEFGLLCKDQLRIDASFQFFVQIIPTPDDVLRVVQTLGSRRAGDAEELTEVFGAKFTETLKSTAFRFEREKLLEDPTLLKDETMRAIGKDLNGFMLVDIVNEHLSPTPELSRPV